MNNRGMSQTITTQISFRKHNALIIDFKNNYVLLFTIFIRYLIYMTDSIILNNEAGKTYRNYYVI